MGKIVNLYIEYNPDDGDITDMDMYVKPSHFANYIAIQGDEYVLDAAHIWATQKVDINADPKLLIDKYTDEEYEAIKLAEAQKVKNKEIDDKTGELISKGFEFDSETFSYSDKAQLNWTAMKAAADMLVYPIELSTLDDGEYSLTEANSAGFFAAAISTKQDHLNSGRALRKQVRQAITIAEVDQVVDNR